MLSRAKPLGRSADVSRTPLDPRAQLPTRELCPHRASGEMGAVLRGEERKAKGRLISSLALDESFSYWFVQGDMPQGREGVKLGALQDAPSGSVF